MRIIVAAAGVICASVLALAPAQAEKRVALVVGNAAYRNVPELPNTRNDAADISASLARLGFAVKQVSDGSYDQMRRALLEFGREARGADMAVVFYAGHGMEVGGENWLIPVDAELRSDIDADSEAIALKTAMLQVSGATRLGLVILDACRNNPFAAKMQRSGGRTRAVDRGFVRVEPADNVLVAYAAKDGTVASDGKSRNSPFTAALLRHIEKPGLEITFLFRAVRDEVIAQTRREQQPFVYGSLSQQAIYLKAPVAPPPVVAAPPAAVPQVDPAERAWATIQSTASVAVLEEFIRQFGATVYGSMARARLEEVRKSQVALAVPVVPAAPAPVQPPPAAAAPPANITAIRAAMPDNLKISAEVLRTVLTDPFFANAPAVRIARYATAGVGSTTPKSKHNAEVRSRSLGSHIVQFDDVFDMFDAAGKSSVFRSERVQVYAANGLVNLSNSTRSRSRAVGNTGKPQDWKPYENSVRRVTNIDRLTGPVFPLAAGNKFGYRVRMSEAGSSSEDEIEYECQVAKRLPASEFHRDLTGQAYVVACDARVSSVGNGSASTIKETNVFFDALGAFVRVDTVDTKQVRVNEFGTHVLKTVARAK